MNRDQKSGLALVCILIICIIIAVRSHERNLTSVSQENITPLPSRSFVPDSSWKIAKHANSHEIEGYASLDSVSVGQTIQFAISSITPQYSVSIYRMGWYDGEGAAKILTLQSQNGQAELIPMPDTQTGLIEPNWPYQLKLTVPSNWLSGMYFAKLTTASGYESYIPFVIKPLKRKQAVLLVHSVLTDEAYNDWGGNSLYRGQTIALHIPRAVEVSLHRPFRQYDGAGYFLEWEYPMVRFLEKNNYQLDYATDIDIHNNPELVQKYALVVIVGHDEYWTKAMRDGYEAALANGTNLAIFAANTGYRQVRLTGSTEIGYKDAYLHDPMYQKDNSVVTTNWRDAPVSRPESVLIGSSFGLQVDKAYQFVATNSNHWIYQNTGLKNGDAIDTMVGYECDSIQPDLPQPAHLIMVSLSPVHRKGGDNEKEGTQNKACNSSIYTTSNGATVFNAGTVQWSSGLDDYHENPGHVSLAIQRITKNIIDRLGK